MNNIVSILAVLENTSMRHNLVALHGQSLLLNYCGSQYLFDVGETFIALKHNLNIMNVDISSLKGIIISHKHADHSGALPELIPLLAKQKLYILPDLSIEQEKNQSLKLEGHEKYGVSMDAEKTNIIKNYKNTIYINKEKGLENSLFLTGPIGDRVKEQSLVIDLKHKGIAILTGCSHPTLPVIVKRAQEITKNKKIYGIIGGLHLKNLKKSQFKQYIDFLERLKPSFIAPGHCTGYRAITELKRRLKDKVILSSTGSLGVGNTIQLFPELQFDFI